MRSRKLLAGLTLSLGLAVAVVATLLPAVSPALEGPEGGSGFASSQQAGSGAQRAPSLRPSPVAQALGAAAATGAQQSAHVEGLVQGPGTAAAPPEEVGTLARVRSFFADALSASQQRKVELTRACPEGCVKCASDADCPGGVGCGLQLQGGKFEAVCLPSNCAVDADCASGLTCRNVSARASAVQVLRCTQPGARREGDACFPFSGDSASSCGPGLTCPLLTCARACESDGQCRDGERCMRGGCTRACAMDADCGAGNACVHVNDGTFCRALRGHQPNCHEAGSECDPGDTCLTAGDGTSVVFSCNQRCGGPQACGAGYVCGAAGVYSLDSPSACYRACAADSDCSDTEVCSLADTAGGQRGCVPAPRNYVAGPARGDGGVSTSL